MSFDFQSFSWIELIGLVASCMLIATFWMKTLVSLRAMAITTSAVFVIYGYFAEVTSLIILHSALFLLNSIRVWQHFLASKRFRTSGKDVAELKALIPFMNRKLLASGTVLFLKGDRATKIFYLSQGSIDIPEVGKTLNAGTLFGEVGLFTPDQKRTASAVCAETCEIFVIHYRDIVRQCLKDPAFGLFLTGLIAGRMAENQEPWVLKSETSKIDSF
ncbi:MAG: cyclic nucleotide-binding domain-containing protein [Roseobacter sp.]